MGPFFQEYRTDTRDLGRRDHRNPFSTEDDPDKGVGILFLQLADYNPRELPGTRVEAPVLNRYQ